jgi:hypothetical protein
MNIPSLFMIPSAVSSGKVYSVYPNTTDADFDFTRDSDATRVNSEGLIERVGYYGSELVTNGDFLQSGTVTSTSWTLGWRSSDSGISIANGNLILARATSDCRPYLTDGTSSINVVTSGKKYKLTYTVIANSDNADLFYHNGGSYVTAPNSEGTHTIDYTTAGTIFLFRNNTNNSTIKIDNVSIKEITGDRARLNYEIEGGLVNSKCSLLLEPQSTNSNTYSNDFTQTFWSKQNSITVSSNQTESPEGVVNADKLISANATSEQYLLNSAISTTSGNDVTISCFVKKLDYDYFHIRFTATGGVWVAASVWYNIDNGTLGTVESGITAKIEDYGNGWYRCSATRTATGTGSGRVRLQLASSNNSGSVVGNGTNGTFIYGAQWEVGSYTTSYIPTNGSAQTRDGENCFGAGTSSILPSEGILYVEFADLYDGDNSSFNRFYTLSDGTTNNVIRITKPGSGTNKISYAIKIGGSLVSSQAKSVTNIKDFNKVAIYYKSGNQRYYINGVLKSAVTATYTMFQPTTLSFGQHNGNARLGSKCRDIRVYNTKEMTDSEVDILLTKITS